jgi:hypothetical protein
LDLEPLYDCLGIAKNTLPEALSASTCMVVRCQV